MRVVLDTNIILSSISRYSPYRIIIDSFEKNNFELCITNDILLEYEEKLTEIFSGEVASLFAGALLLKENVLRTDIYFQWNLIKNDADDNKFVDCAVSSGADYLVTNDKDFKEINSIEFPSVAVIDIDEFVSVLQNFLNKKIN